MKNIRHWMTTALGCALLAACGGGDLAVPGTGTTSGAPTTKGGFTSLVVFGDSLSDLGTYTPATQIPGTNPPVYVGGKFTTNGGSNGSNGTIWVENLATTLGLIITPAEMGFAGQSLKCPAAGTPGLAATCTGYGQGGSRVTDPNGIGHNGGAGALTVPVVTQIANHLANPTFGGSFKSTDLIILWAGNNDAFVQFGAFTAAATQIQTDLLSGKITTDQANLQLFQAQTAAQAGMKQAAQELAGYIKSQILAKGGKYVAVFNLPDSTLTPFGASLKADPASAGAVPVLSGLVDIFNLWLRDSLTDQPVQIVDQNGPGKDVYANPTKYGLVDNQHVACDPAKMAPAAAGSSLFCNAQFGSLTTGADVLTWQFADSVHPSTGGHKIISDYVTQQLKAFGWI
jgi:phospholipase/lecithinase/hemolysin